MVMSLRVKFMLSAEQAGFTDQSYCFGSTAVQERKINGKPKVTAAEELMCLDGSYIDKMYLL